jgi:hypothetical protein
MPVLHRLLHPANKEVAVASRAVVAMHSATNLVQFEDEWKHFLDALEKSWTKLEVALAHAPKSVRAWLSSYVNFRRTDSLVVYLHHARNADQHTLLEIVEKRPAELGIRRAPGAKTSYINTMIIDGEGKLAHFDAVGMQAIVTPPAIALLPVIDRGREFAVPHEHYGMPLTTVAPNCVAVLGLRFYEVAISEASERLHEANVA